jgi:hypothetical protein
MTKKQKKYLSTVKTWCCKSDYIRLSRASYNCAKCEKDVSFEYFVSMVSLAS